MTDWKTVPVEPTEEMKLASVGPDEGQPHYNLRKHYTKIIYQSMLSAAPPPPVCHWRVDHETNDWYTGCGDGMPFLAGMKFCCFCGHPIAAHPYEEGEE